MLQHLNQQQQQLFVQTLDAVIACADSALALASAGTAPTVREVEKEQQDTQQHQQELPQKCKRQQILLSSRQSRRYLAKSIAWIDLGAPAAAAMFSVLGFNEVALEILSGECWEEYADVSKCEPWSTLSIEDSILFLLESHESVQSKVLTVDAIFAASDEFITQVIGCSGLSRSLSGLVRAGYRFRRPSTLLHLAAQNNHPSLVRKLLDLNASLQLPVNPRSDESYATRYAAWYGHSSVLKELWDACDCGCRGESHVANVALMSQGVLHDTDGNRLSRRLQPTQQQSQGQPRSQSKSTTSRVSFTTSTTTHTRSVVLPDSTTTFTPRPTLDVSVRGFAPLITSFTRGHAQASHVLVHHEVSRGVHTFLASIGAFKQSKPADWDVPTIEEVTRVLSEVLRDHGSVQWVESKVLQAIQEWLGECVRRAIRQVCEGLNGDEEVEGDEVTSYARDLVDGKWMDYTNIIGGGDEADDADDNMLEDDDGDCEAELFETNLSHGRYLQPLLVVPAAPQR